MCLDPLCSECWANGEDNPIGTNCRFPSTFVEDDVHVTVEDLRNAARSRTTLGRDEASAALQTLVHYHHGEGAPGAVDITEGSGFDWLRWVAPLEGAREVSRDGVHRAYAVRWEASGAPEAVFCYSSGNFAVLVPRRARLAMKGSTRNPRA